MFCTKGLKSVSDKPSKPEIKLIWPDSSAVKEGGYIRATCNSTSRTHPKNPDSNLTYKFTITESPELDHQTRVIVKNNEIMIAALTKEDDKLIITCTVWEDDRIHMNASGSFVLHVSENNVSSKLHEVMLAEPALAITKLIREIRHIV